jgi:putative SOS response-associated peptidase YedK
MCGRYQRRSDKQKIAEAFHLGNVDGLALEFAPDYNAAPQSLQPVIVWDKQFGARSLHMMFWRFLPPYVTDPKKFRLDTINARGESLMDSNVWRDAFLHSRCLVPVDSFIEWKRVDAKTKLPWVFAMKDDEPFALAGVYRRWRSPDRKLEMDTFAIITTEPNELLAEKTGHDRMPVIIKRSDYQRWLEPGNEEQPPIDLIRPFDSDKMKAWRVDRRINNVKINEPSLDQPVQDDAPIPEKPKRVDKPKRKPKSDDSGQLGMFG